MYLYLCTTKTTNEDSWDESWACQSYIHIVVFISFQEEHITTPKSLHNITALLLHHELISLEDVYHYVSHFLLCTKDDKDIRVLRYIGHPLNIRSKI